MGPRNRTEKFILLANKRVNRAIKDLKLVANLANKKNYDFTDEQAKKIVKALKKALGGVEKSFHDVYLDPNDEFHL